MTLLILTLVLVGMLAIRVGYIALQLRNLERFWYDLDRRGFQYQMARGLSYATTLVFFACAIYIFWNLGATEAWPAKYATVFVAWFGMSLLSKLSLHHFPRTNSPQMFAAAKVALIVNVVTATVSGLLMTGITAIYYWFHG